MSNNNPYGESLSVIIDYVCEIKNLLHKYNNVYETHFSTVQAVHYLCVYAIE